MHAFVSPTAAEAMSDEDQGLFESLAATFVNNVQVTIERVHVRYEDTITTPGHPFACGVMLTSLAAETTDAAWRPTQVDGTATEIHKVRVGGCEVIRYIFVLIINVKRHL